MKYYPSPDDWTFPPHADVNADLCKLRRNGEWRRLTRNEWLTFFRLAQSSDRYVTHQQIYDAIYGDEDPDGGPCDSAVSGLVTKVRKKCPFEIKTMYGIGYVLFGYHVTKTVKVLPNAAFNADLARLRSGR